MNRLGNEVKAAQVAQENNFSQILIFLPSFISITFLLCIWLHLTLLIASKSLRQPFWVSGLTHSQNFPDSSLVSIKNTSNEIHYLWFIYTWAWGTLRIEIPSGASLKTQTTLRHSRLSLVFLSTIYSKTLICLRLNLTTWSQQQQICSRAKKCDVTEQPRCFLLLIMRKLRCHNHSDINWILKHFVLLLGKRIAENWIELQQPSRAQTTGEK